MGSIPFEQNTRTFGFLKEVGGLSGKILLHAAASSAHYGTFWKLSDDATAPAAYQVTAGKTLIIEGFYVFGQGTTTVQGFEPLYGDTVVDDSASGPTNGLSMVRRSGSGTATDLFPILIGSYIFIPVRLQVPAQKYPAIFCPSGNAAHVIAVGREV